MNSQFPSGLSIQRVCGGATLDRFHPSSVTAVPAADVSAGARDPVSLYVIMAASFIVANLHPESRLVARRTSSDRAEFPLRDQRGVVARICDGDERLVQRAGHAEAAHSCKKRPRRWDVVLEVIAHPPLDNGQGSVRRALTVSLPSSAGHLAITQP